jgi:hypothetical protein
LRSRNPTFADGPVDDFLSALADKCRIRAYRRPADEGAVCRLHAAARELEYAADEIDALATECLRGDGRGCTVDSR